MNAENGILNIIALNTLSGTCLSCGRCNVCNFIVVFQVLAKYLLELHIKYLEFCLCFFELSVQNVKLLTYSLL